jgi:pimeloyl-ACP methyl ester carboxylesterase
VPTDPSVAGRFAVEQGTTELTVPDFGTYPALTFRPVANTAPGGAGVEPPARMPGIVLSNGLAASGSLMGWISNHLASHGYAVLTFTPANTLSVDMTAWASGFQRGIDAFLGENGESAGSLDGLVDPARIGLVALSAGGAGAIEAAGKDPRVDAVVAFAPGINDLGRFLFQETIDAASHIEAPTQIQVGTEDCLVNPRSPSLLAFTNLGHASVETYYDAIPARRQFLEIAGANHVDYFDEPQNELWISVIVDAIPIDCAPRIPAAEQHRVARKYTTMWLDTHLYGTTAWQDGLFGSGVESDLSLGVLSRVRSAGS